VPVAQLQAIPSAAWRISGYHLHADESASEYIESGGTAREITDPILSFQLSKRLFSQAVVAPLPARDKKSWG